MTTKSGSGTRRRRLSRRPSRIDVDAGATPAPSAVVLSPFQSVRDRLVAATPECSIHEILDRLICVDGAVDSSLSVLQLTAAERLGLEILASPSEGPVLFKGSIGYTSIGKPYIDLPGAPPASSLVAVLDPVMVIGWTADQVNLFVERVSCATEAEQEDWEFCRKDLFELENEGVLAKQVRELRELLPYLEPIVVLHGHVAITNFDSPRSLIGHSLRGDGEHCLLFELDATPLRDWPREAVLFVSLARQLISRWGPWGVEYLNGIQLSREALVLDEYESTVASDVGELSTRYRRIDGVLRTKRASVVHHDGPRSEVTDALLAVLVRYGVDTPTLASGIERLRDAQALGATSVDRSFVFSNLIESVLKVVCCLTGADLTMSRGMRNLPLLVTAALTGDRTPLLASDMDDHFCCVVDNSGQRGDEVADRLWGIASRMRYNAWHCRPWGGVEPPNLGESETYFPPSLPDIATFADFQHPGHVNYRIRHTVRAPRTVQVGGAQFIGLVDVRLARSAGSSFTVEDMLVAMNAVEIIGAAYEGLVSAAVSESGTHDIDTFELDWYRERYL